MDPQRALDTELGGDQTKRVDGLQLREAEQPRSIVTKKPSTIRRRRRANSSRDGLLQTPGTPPEFAGAVLLVREHMIECAYKVGGSMPIGIS